jgi:hypothetical protein
LRLFHLLSDLLSVKRLRLIRYSPARIESQSVSFGSRVYRQRQHALGHSPQVSRISHSRQPHSPSTLQETKAQLGNSLRGTDEIGSGLYLALGTVPDVGEPAITHTAHHARARGNALGAAGRRIFLFAKSEFFSFMR